LKPYGEGGEMKRILKRVHMKGLALALMIGLSASVAQAKLVPKVDNFILFADQSGSMYMHHEALKQVKMLMAKQILTEMNGQIPELGFKGSLCLFAPFQQIQAPIVFDRGKFAAGIKKIPEDQDIYGRLTPMGWGLSYLEPMIGSLSGRTALIILSDGGVNLGTDPYQEAVNIHNRFPQVCFHVVSFAEEAKDKALLKRISGIASCIMVEGGDLVKSKPALEKFVRDVFFEEESEKEAPKRGAFKEDTIVLRGINFDFNKFDIKPEFKPILDEVASKLKKNPEVNIVVEGHTDAVGSEEYNQKLSERRAYSVYEYFAQKGVARSRMSTMGYGKLRPVADNKTAAGAALNRRVELKVVK